jgi:hypothetical protein
MKGKIMTESKKEINIARIIYDAYPHSDLLPIDPDKDCRNLQTLLAKVTNEDIGDGLFKFIVTEIVEGGESKMTGAILVMERAKRDLDAVLHALHTKVSNGSSGNWGKAADYIVEQGRKIFIGPITDGLWNARYLDACILSQKKGDKAAYELLLKFGDEYAQQLPESQKVLWQEIKDKASAMLNPEVTNYETKAI